MNQQENDNTTVVADLPVDQAQEDVVKGGEVNDQLGKTYYISGNGGIWKTSSL